MKHFLENENLILLIYAGLAAIVVILAIIPWFKFRKLEKELMADDDFPGRYEDSERPYYEYFN